MSETRSEVSQPDSIFEIPGNVNAAMPTNDVANVANVTIYYYSAFRRAEGPILRRYAIESPAAIRVEVALDAQRLIRQN
ncbi:hypothetical protein E4U52_001012 [Claviceps spartinae]|nr:hypothetical protein E4U52_001012 [Claviceps spartinae]